MSNIKILCIGDPHIKESSITETEILIKSIIETIKRQDPEIVVVMGDTLHNHEKINCTIQIIAVRFFEKIFEAMSLMSKLYILIGNHDICDPHSFLSENHAFYSLKDKNPRCIIVDKPIVENYSDHIFMFVPFVPNGRFKEAYSTVISEKGVADKISTIFCHQEFTGVVIESFISDVERLNEDMPLCIAGHIHKYQIVSDNLVYIGTPYQHRFGEDEDKALMLLHYIDGKVDIERIRLENIPLKTKLSLSKEEFENFDLTDQFNKYKIEVCAYPEEIQALKFSDKHNNLQKMSNVKLSYNQLSEKEPAKNSLSASKVSISFKMRLEEAINRSEDLLKHEIHKLICGKM